MKGLYFHLCLVTMTLVASISAATPAAPAGGGPLLDECSKDIQTVSLCLDFATGKAPNPSEKCCDAIEAIKEKDPKCLCFLIQQAKSGGQSLKDLGVQEAKLIQLPTSCQLRNASISNCPTKLLGIPPSSPEAAVFTSNATSTSTPVAPGGKSPAAPATSSEKGGSVSIKDGHAVMALAVAFTTISFLSTLPRMGLA